MEFGEWRLGFSGQGLHSNSHSEIVETRTSYLRSIFRNAAAQSAVATIRG